jgi:hypothetical protein
MARKSFDQLESESAEDALKAEKKITTMLRRLGYRRRRHEMNRFYKGRKYITVEIDGWVERTDE